MSRNMALTSSHKTHCLTLSRFQLLDGMVGTGDGVGVTGCDPQIIME